MQKALMMPLNLLLLNLPPAPAGAASAEKSSLSTELLLNCMSTIRSPLSGSLFLLSHWPVE